MHKVINKHQLYNLSLLSNFAVPKEALMCPNMIWKDVHHIAILCVIYDDIKRSVNASREALCQPKSYPALDRGGMSVCPCNLLQLERPLDCSKAVSRWSGGVAK